MALVDIDSKRLESAAKTLARHYTDAKVAQPEAPKLFSDYRQMFDSMANTIDAVIVSTPDHSHYPAAVWALNHGKPVCVQKPLCCRSR